MTDPVKSADVRTSRGRPATVRTRRATKAEQTRSRIVAAATDLFAEHGYAATSLDAIADRADVAVETIYKRFRNKIGLLEAIVQPAVVGAADGRDIFDDPEIAVIAAQPDQREQVRRLAAFSRGILERVYAVQGIVAGAAAADPRAVELARRNTARRLEGQRRYIDLLLRNGPLRRGLSPEDAAATYSALANPQTFSLMVRELGWTADHYQAWLGATLAAALLEPGEMTE